MPEKGGNHNEKLVTSQKNTSLFIPHVSVKMKACASMRGGVSNNKRPKKADLIIFSWNKAFLWRVLRLIVSSLREVQRVRQGMKLRHRIFWSIIRENLLDYQDDKLLQYRGKLDILFLETIKRWGSNDQFSATEVVLFLLTGTRVQTVANGPQMPFSLQEKAKVKVRSKHCEMPKLNWGRADI